MRMWGTGAKRKRMIMKIGCQSCLEKRVRDRISSSMDRLIGNIPKYAYFLTHTDNLVHILRDGILAPNQRPSSYTKISNPGIVRRRDTQIHLPNGEPLNCYAHSYFRPNNAMLFNVLTEQNFKLDQIAIIEIKLDIAVNEYVFTPKNAAVCKRDDFCFPTADDPKTWRSLTYPKTREILETTKILITILVTNSRTRRNGLMVATIRARVKREKGKMRKMTKNWL